MWLSLILPFIALVASLILTPVARRLGPRLGAMDMPNPLSIHSVPTPRTSGLAIFAGFLIAVRYGLVTTPSRRPDSSDERQ